MLGSPQHVQHTVAGPITVQLTTAHSSTAKLSNGMQNRQSNFLKVPGICNDYKRHVSCQYTPGVNACVQTEYMCMD